MGLLYRHELYNRISDALSHCCIDRLGELNQVLEKGIKIHADEEAEAEIVYKEYEYWLMRKFFDKTSNFDSYNYNVFSFWSQKKRRANFDALWSIYQNCWSQVLFFAISFEDFFEYNEHWYTPAYQKIKDYIVAHKMRLGAMKILYLYEAFGQKEWPIIGEERTIKEMVWASKEKA